MNLDHLSLSERAKAALKRAYPKANVMDEDEWRDAIRQYGSFDDLNRHSDRPTALEIIRWARAPKTPIEDIPCLPLSKRTRHCISMTFSSNQSWSLDQWKEFLRSRTDAELLRVPGIGRGAFSEIRQWAGTEAEENIRETLDRQGFPLRATNVLRHAGLIRNGMSVEEVAAILSKTSDDDLLGPNCGRKTVLQVRLWQAKLAGRPVTMFDEMKAKAKRDMERAILRAKAAYKKKLAKIDAMARES